MVTQFDRLVEACLTQDADDRAWDLEIDARDDMPSTWQDEGDQA